MRMRTTPRKEMTQRVHLKTCRKENSDNPRERQHQDDRSIEEEAPSSLRISQIYCRQTSLEASY